jgi:hypothetical protein
MTSTRFPDSEISGSTPVCGSPKLFAANHVLHRLLTPRHSPCALSSLATNFIWNPERVPNLPTLASMSTAHLRSGPRARLKGLALELGSWAPGLPEKVIRLLRTCEEGCSGRGPGSLNLVAHHYFLVRYAVYKVENEVQ